MGYGKAEDAGGLSPVKDDNAVRASFLPPNFTDSQPRRLYAQYSPLELRRRVFSFKSLPSGQTYTSLASS